MNRILLTPPSLLPDFLRLPLPSLLPLILPMVVPRTGGTLSALLSVRTGRLLSHSFLSSTTMSSSESLGAPRRPLTSGMSTPITRISIPRSVRYSLPNPKICSSPKPRRRSPLDPRSRSSTSTTPSSIWLLVRLLLWRSLTIIISSSSKLTVQMLLITNLPIPTSPL